MNSGRWGVMKRTVVLGGCGWEVRRKGVYFKNTTAFPQALLSAYSWASMGHRALAGRNRNIQMKKEAGIGRTKELVMPRSRARFQGNTHGDKIYNAVHYLR